jgi:hypothetical protein
MPSRNEPSIASRVLHHAMRGAHRLSRVERRSECSVAALCAFSLLVQHLFRRCRGRLPKGAALARRKNKMGLSRHKRPPTQPRKKGGRVPAIYSTFRIFFLPLATPLLAARQGFMRGFQPGRTPSQQGEQS